MDRISNDPVWVQYGNEQYARFEVLSIDSNMPPGSGIYVLSHRVKRNGRYVHYFKASGKGNDLSLHVIDENVYSRAIKDEANCLLTITVQDTREMDEIFEALGRLLSRSIPEG